MDELRFLSTASEEQLQKLTPEEAQGAAAVEYLDKAIKVFADYLAFLTLALALALALTLALALALALTLALTLTRCSRTILPSRRPTNSSRRAVMSN